LGNGFTSTDLRPSPAPPPAPPYHKKLQMFLSTTKRAGAQCESSDPMREADAPSTGEGTHTECARPTEDSHTRTTRDSAQRGEDAKRRPRCIVYTSAAQLVRRSDRDGGGGCPDQILKQKPASKDHVVIPSVAGCTTGSLCPRCPYIQDEVLSLYSKPRFCLRWPHYSRWHGTSVLHSTMCPKAHNMVRWRRYPK
jgi:hypothetical protein